MENNVAFDVCTQCRVIKSSIINVSIIFLDICWVIHWSFAVHHLDCSHLTVLHISKLFFPSAFLQTFSLPPSLLVSSWFQHRAIPVYESPLGKEYPSQQLAWPSFSSCCFWVQLCASFSLYQTYRLESKSSCLRRRL